MLGFLVKRSRLYRELQDEKETLEGQIFEAEDIMDKLANKLKEKEEELKKLQTVMALTMSKPHFVMNDSRGKMVKIDVKDLDEFKDHIISYERTDFPANRLAVIAHKPEK